MLTLIRYMEVYLTFAPLDCVRYNRDFVKLGFCSIHSPVILARQKKIVCSYRGLRYREVRYIEVPMYNDTLKKKITTWQRDFGG